MIRKPVKFKNFYRKSIFVIITVAIQWGLFGSDIHKIDVAAGQHLDLKDVPTCYSVIQKTGEGTLLLSGDLSQHKVDIHCCGGLLAINCETQLPLRTYKKKLIFDGGGFLIADSTAPITISSSIVLNQSAVFDVSTGVNITIEDLRSEHPENELTLKGGGVFNFTKYPLCQFGGLLKTLCVENNTALQFDCNYFLKNIREHLILKDLSQIVYTGKNDNAEAMLLFFEDTPEISIVGNVGISVKHLNNALTIEGLKINMDKASRLFFFGLGIKNIGDPDKAYKNEIPKSARVIFLEGRSNIYDNKLFGDAVLLVDDGAEISVESYEIQKIIGSPDAHLILTNRKKSQCIYHLVALSEAEKKDHPELNAPPFHTER